MAISLKRAYTEAEKGDGLRILVDRIWPRGVSKEKAAIDEWLKDEAPSTQLRKDFHKGILSWEQFQKHYLLELETHRDRLLELARRSEAEQITLVYSARDEQRNNAVVLRQFLQSLASK